MLLAFKEVAVRADMFAHHHVPREPLSVRERMSNILAALEHGQFSGVQALFMPEEGRAGVTVAFIAILELMREGLIDIMQTEPYAPLHVRAPRQIVHCIWSPTMRCRAGRHGGGCGG